MRALFLVALMSGCGSSTTRPVRDGASEASPSEVELVVIPPGLADVIPPHSTRLVVRADGVYLVAERTRQLAQAVDGVVSAEAHVTGSLLIDPLHDALQETFQGREAEDLLHGERRGTRPLLIAVGRDVPYQTVVEVVYTAGRAGGREIGFVVLSDSSEGVLPVTLPTFDQPPADPDLELMIHISEEGLTVAGSGGTLGPNCRGIGDGPTIVRARGVHDWPRLRRCLLKVKEHYLTETRCDVSATADTPWSEVATLLATARTTEAGELFPLLGLGLESEKERGR